MKIVITENKLEKVLKQSGVDKTVKILGGRENFRKVYNINSYEDYLHLFDDLEEVQSTDLFKFRLYRYKSGTNIIAYNTTENRVGISDNEIYSVLDDDLLGLSPVVNYSKQIIQTWLKEVYNIDVEINRIHPMYTWDGISRLE
jgi:hypothetical protein